MISVVWWWCGLVVVVSCHIHDHDHDHATDVFGGWREVKMIVCACVCVQWYTNDCVLFVFLLFFVVLSSDFRV